MWSIVLAFLVLLWSSFAHAVNQCQFAKHVGEVPERIYQVDGFTIYYATRGEHALKYQADRNHNDVPDQIEDIATQLHVSRQLFSAVLGFIDPLKQPRYTGVEDVRVRIMNIDAHGQAFDEPHQFADQKQGVGCSLMIKMSNRLDERTYTPVHELFHLYQYGYTMFKAKWFLEGTARWSESLLKATELKLAPIPIGEDALNVFFDKTYAASEVWHQMAVDTDSEGLFFVPNALKNTNYLSGIPVVEDGVLMGVPLIKAVLEALSRLDHQVSLEQGLAPDHWDEAFQVSASHNRRIWTAVLLEYQKIRAAHKVL